MKFNGGMKMNKIQNIILIYLELLGDGCGAGVLSLATGLQQPVWEDAVVLR